MKNKDIPFDDFDEYDDFLPSKHKAKVKAKAKKKSPKKMKKSYDKFD